MRRCISIVLTSLALQLVYPNLVNCTNYMIPVTPEIVQPVEVTIQIKVTSTEPKLQELQLPQNTSGSFKTYMDYRAITDKTSLQWKLQQDAITDDHGLRKYNNKYMIAVGSYYADKVGKELKITLDSNIVFDAIVADLKMDIHTDENNQYITYNGNIIEFIVDTPYLDNKSRKMGDISYSGFEGNIIKIEEVIK